jgi:hypothetical protein
MKELRITPDSKGEEIGPFALAMHNIMRLPLTMRSLNEKGVRIEDGKIIEFQYTGPILEQVLKENRLIRAVPISGTFKGKCVIVAPIRDDEGNVLAAIGISDQYGAIDFIECFCSHPIVIDEVEKCVLSKMKP